jgi:hypothetical protein
MHPSAARHSCSLRAPRSVGGCSHGRKPQEDALDTLCASRPATRAAHRKRRRMPLPCGATAHFAKWPRCPRSPARSPLCATPPPNLPSFRLEEDRRELGGGECGLGRHDSDRLRHGSHWKGFDNEVGAGWGIRVGGCGGPGGKGVVTASYRSARCSPRCRRRRWNRRAQGHQGLRGCRMPEHGGDGRRRRHVRHGSVDVSPQRD